MIEWQTTRCELHGPHGLYGRVSREPPFGWSWHVNDRERVIAEGEEPSLEAARARVEEEFARQLLRLGSQMERDKGDR